MSGTSPRRSVNNVPGTYKSELNRWRSEYYKAATARFLHGFFADQFEHTLALEVCNPTGVHLEDLEVTVELPAGSRVLALSDDRKDPPELPEPPRRFGTGSRAPGSSLLSGIVPGLPQPWYEPVDPGPFLSFVELDDHDASRFYIHISKLRQDSTFRAEALDVHLGPGPTSFEFRWTARIRTPEAVVSGTVSLERAATSTRPSAEVA